MAVMQLNFTLFGSCQATVAKWAGNLFRPIRSYQRSKSCQMAIKDEKQALCTSSSFKRKIDKKMCPSFNTRVSSTNNDTFPKSTNAENTRRKFSSVTYETDYVVFLSLPAYNCEQSQPLLKQFASQNKAYVYKHSHKKMRQTYMQASSCHSRNCFNGCVFSYLKVL